MTSELQDKVALVTGGATGIGWAIASALADAGCRVAIAGRREEKLRQAVESRSAPPPIRRHRVDVTDRASVNQLVKWTAGNLGPIDILVNGAGVNIKNRTMAGMSPEEWDRVMAINATGAYNCMYAVLPQMRDRQDGLIVNISSISGKRALDLGGVAYCASKFAMTALGTAVGQEEAPHGIRVTNVYPGEVDTPILEQRPQPVSAEHRQRMLQPADVAAMVRAIACLSPRAHVPEILIKPRLQGYC
jgi:NAD(P)-dependent dehydrogenase (short-subunit alcohol dehydrogenase family)